MSVKPKEKLRNYSRSNKHESIFSEEPFLLCVFKCLDLSEVLWNKVLLLWLDISNASQIMDHHCLRWITFWGTQRSLYLKQSKSCDVTRLILRTFCLPPLGVGGSPTLGWYWRRRERADISFKRETCWTSFFPCHGLATAGGEQCNQPPWENIVVRPPLMTLDWIWRDAGGGDSQRTNRGEVCL